jgi:hypothetical protein
MIAVPSSDVEHLDQAQNSNQPDEKITKMRANPKQ